MLYNVLMPTRHVVKVYAPNHYYHVFNRGWNLTKIFIDKQDYAYFEDLFARYLGNEPRNDKSGKPYRNYAEDVHLNAYCLMGNHFHLLLYQFTESGVQELMASILIAYTMYFNRRHGRRGPLFESTFKAVIILEDSQLMHITRYIHLNHSHYQTWAHSSYGDYAQASRDWIDPAPILEIFGDQRKYEEFVADYEELQRERDEIKHDLFGKSA
jgi:putative transposase